MLNRNRTNILTEEMKLMKQQMIEARRKEVSTNKIFLDSLNIQEFDRLFGIGRADRDYIHDIKFSNFKELVFICNHYIGKVH